MKILATVKILLMRLDAASINFIYSFYFLYFSSDLVPSASDHFIHQSSIFVNSYCCAYIYIYIYIYVVISISFQSFLYRHLKL